MSRKLVLLVAGTRPEIIKLWPVYSALKRSRHLQVKFVNTGQQKDLSRQAAEVFNVRFDHDLRVMTPDQTLAGLTSSLTLKLDRLLRVLKPDMVIVQGDTTSAFVAALSAYYLKIPVAHVEAGLRTGNRYEPFPEELNRTLVGQLAVLHFAPMPIDVRALLNEGVDRRSIYLTGNTVVDAAKAILRTSKFRAPWPRPFVLVTLHRRENFERTIHETSLILQEVLRRRPGLSIVWPLHPNPNVRRAVSRSLWRHPRCVFVEPLPYERFLVTMREAEIVISDSGGVQEEAPSVGTRVVVIRNVTERSAAVKGGWCVLAGDSKPNLLRAIEQVLTHPEPPKKRNPFGDGHAGEKIAKAIVRYLKDLGKP